MTAALAAAATAAAAEGPIALRARKAKLPPDMDGAAFVVPFAATTGAASFRQGDNTYIVFDERRPVDMAALKDDAVFGSVSVQLLPAGTLFRLPNPSGQSLALTQMPRGWRIAAVTAVSPPEAIKISQAEGRLTLAAAEPGDVVVLPDPDTGATLLAGTQRRSGQAVASQRRNSEFTLRQTLQGVVVEIAADTAGMKPDPSGFILSGPPGGLSLSPETGGTAGLMDAANLTRRLDLPPIPADSLFRLVKKQFGLAAAAAPMARGPYRRDAARSLLALGFAAEAESLLRLAAEQDPAVAASPDTKALTAIAALLANRPDEAEALNDTDLNGTDEIALWRGIRLAMRDEGSPAAAAIFAATAPLALRYPAPVRDRILPLIAETMILGGEIPAAARFAGQRKSDPKLGFARALLRQAEGETEQALSAFGALANGHDQFDRARAAVRAVELRLAANRMDKGQAADALDKLLYVWRGDARELALRERVAALRADTGAWRQALDILRQARTDFPDDAAAVQEQMKNTMAAMIRDRDRNPAPPLEFVATVDDNADALPASGDDNAAERALAGHLVALDLPSRARPLLAKLSATAKSPAARAQFGASLAALEEREGNHDAARSALDSSDAPELPADLAERRALTRAAAAAALGDRAAAAAGLRPFHSPEATETRARILEDGGDWAGAAAAWMERLEAEPGDSDPLAEPAARIAVRLAAATARAGDIAGLARLHGRFDSRIGTGPLADMFRLLAVTPVTSAADLSRSHAETALTASLPADLNALRAPAK